LVGNPKEVRVLLLSAMTSPVFNGFELEILRNYG